MNIGNNYKKKRILIIDDNKQIHLDFKKIILIAKEKESDLDKFEKAILGDIEKLKHEKFIINCASQGEEGLKMVEESLIKNEPYAVAFVDVRMPPGWDGIETISRIWKIYPDLQIVICTAYSDYSWEEIVKKLGYTDKLLILKKPFDNIEARQLAFALSEKWELTRIASLKMSDLERNVEVRTKELRDTKDYLQCLMDSSLDLIFTVKKDGTFGYFNQKLKDLTGYTEVEVLGKNFMHFIPDEKKEFMQKKWEEINKGISGIYDTKIIKKDSTIADVQVSHSVLEGYNEFLVVLKDITERKQAEKALRESEELFRSIVEYSHDGIVIVDDAYRLLYVNDELCRTFGYSREEIIGQNFRKFLDEESKQLLIDRYIRRQRGEKVPPRYESNIMRKDGEKRHVELSSTVIKDSAGKVKTVAQILDITERKRAEETLREKMSELQLFYDVAKDREARIIELKEEVNELLTQLDEKKKYGV